MGRCADRDYWDYVLWKANIKPPIEKSHTEHNTIVSVLKDDVIVLLEKDYHDLIQRLRDHQPLMEFNDNLGQ